MALCLIVIVIALSLFPFSTTLKMFILIAVILGIGWALLYPCLMVHAIENSGASQGPTMATFTALGDLGIGIGPMIIGAVLQWTSYPIMFICLALTAAINLLFFYGTIGKKAGIFSKERKNEIV